MGKDKSNKEKIKMFREIDPTRMAANMAKELNITRERVRQILNDLGLPTAFPKPRRICGNEGCNNKIKQYRDTAKFCGRACVKAQSMGSFICAYCGKENTKYKYLIKLQQSKYKNMHCTHSCSSKAYWAKKKKNSINMRMGWPIYRNLPSYQVAREKT